jgi:hypothetical protein
VAQVGRSDRATRGHPMRCQVIVQVGSTYFFDADLRFDPTPVHIEARSVTHYPID